MILLICVLLYICEKQDAVNAYRASCNAKQYGSWIFYATPPLSGCLSFSVRALRLPPCKSRLQSPKLMEKPLFILLSARQNASNTLTVYSGVYIGNELLRCWKASLFKLTYSRSDILLNRHVLFLSFFFYFFKKIEWNNFGLLN